MKLFNDIKDTIFNFLQSILSIESNQVVKTVLYLIPIISIIIICLFLNVNIFIIIFLIIIYSVIVWTSLHWKRVVKWIKSNKKKSMVVGVAVSSLLGGCLVLFDLQELPTTNFITLYERGSTYNIYYNSDTEQYYSHLFSGDVNYQNETGVYNPINTTIQVLPQDHPARQYGYAAYANRGLYAVYFKQNAQDDYPICFAYNRGDSNVTHALRSKLIGVGYYDPSSGHDYTILQTVLNSQGTMDGNTGTYSNILSGVDAEWVYGKYGLKEDLIMSNTTKTLLQNHPPSDYGYNNQNSYVVIVTKMDYKNVYSYNGSTNISSNFTFHNGIKFKDALGKVLFAMPTGFVYEQNNKSSVNDLIYRLVRHNGEYYLLSGIKATTLNNMEFPVVFDPAADITAESDDGIIITGTDANWDNIRDATTGTADSSVASTLSAVKAILSKSQYQISRTFFEFDTSNLPDGATINTLHLFIYGTATIYGSDDTIVIASSQGEALDNDDFNNIDFNTPYSSEVTSWTASNWNDITLNQDGKDAVSLVGKTYMALVNHDYDYLDSDPLVNNGVGCYFSEETGKEPYLNITYSIPNTAPTFSGEIPSADSGDIGISPTMNITIWDDDDEDTTIDWYYNATIGSGSWTHIDHYTGHPADTSNTTTATSGINQYNHWYNIKVTADDGQTGGNSTKVWKFKTIDYTPDTPASFVSTAYLYKQINLTWTDDTEADSTRVEWNPDADGTWNVDDHSFLYNGSAEQYEHTGLHPNKDYFYKVWSWNSTQGVWSSGSISSETIGKAPILYTLTTPFSTLEFNLQNNTNNIEPTGQNVAVYAINITNNNSKYMDLDIRLNETTIDNVSLYYNIEYDNSSSNWAIYSATTNITCMDESGSVYWRYCIGDTKTKPGITYYNGSIYTQLTTSPCNFTRLNASTETMSAAERTMAAVDLDQILYSTPLHSNGYTYCATPGAVEGHCVISCHYSNNLTLIWESDTKDLNGIDYYTRIYSQLAMADGILLWMDDNWNVVALGNLTQYNSSFHTDWDEYGRTYSNHMVAESNSSVNLSKDVLWTANATGTFDEYGGVSVHDGIVYVSPKDAYLESFPGHSGMSAIYLNNGTIKWQDTVDINSDSTPTYWNGYLYTQSLSDGNNNSIYCLDASDGSLVWSHNISHTDGGVGCIGSVSNDGIIVTSCDGYLYAFYAMNGTELWNVNLYGEESYSAGIAPLTINNSVYIINADTATSSSIFYSYNLHNGTKNWEVVDGGSHWDSNPCAVNYGGNKEKLYNYSLQLDDALAPGESCTLYLWADLDGNMTSDFSRYINITLSANEEGYETEYVEVEAWFNLSNTGDWSNTAPTITNPGPVNGATGQSLTPTINATIWDVDGNTTTIDWYYSLDNSSWTFLAHVTNHPANTSNSTTATFADSYNTKYYWNLTANDGHDNTTSTVWNFTTLDATPDVPTGFSATNISSSQINLGWTKGTNHVDTTYIERNATAVTVWARGAGTMIYNDTGTAKSDTGLDADTHYYYQAWSYNATQNVYSITNDSVDNMTQITSSLSVSLPFPTNNSQTVLTGIGNLSVLIKSTGSWNISLYDNSTRTLQAYASGASSSNVVQYCDVTSALYYAFDKSYTWYVNATDGSTWDNNTYYFTTFNGSGFVYLDNTSVNTDTNMSTLCGLDNTEPYVYALDSVGKKLVAYSYKNGTLEKITETTLPDSPDEVYKMGVGNYIHITIKVPAATDIIRNLAYDFDGNSFTLLHNRLSGLADAITINDVDVIENGTGDWLFYSITYPGVSDFVRILEFNGTEYNSGEAIDEIATFYSRISVMETATTYLCAIDSSNDIQLFTFNESGTHEFVYKSTYAGTYLDITNDNLYFYGVSDTSLDICSVNDTYNLVPEYSYIDSGVSVTTIDDKSFIGSSDGNLLSYIFEGGEFTEQQSVSMVNNTKSVYEMGGFGSYLVSACEEGGIHLYGYELVRVAPPVIDLIYAGDPSKYSVTRDGTIRYVNQSYNNQTFCNVTANITVPDYRTMGRYFKTTDDDIFIPSGNLTDGDTDYVHEQNHSLIATQWECTYTGEYSQISGYLIGSGMCPPWVGYAIYTDNAGSPGTLLGFTERDWPGSDTFTEDQRDNVGVLYYPPCTRVWFTGDIAYDGSGISTNSITLTDETDYWLVIATNDSYGYTGYGYTYSNDIYWLLGNSLGDTCYVKTAPYNISSDMNFSNVTSPTWSNHATAHYACIYAIANSTYNTVPTVDIASATLHWYNNSVNTWNMSMTEIGDTGNWTKNVSGLTFGNWYTFDITAYDELADDVTYEHYRYLIEGTTEYIEFQCNVPYEDEGGHQGYNSTSTLYRNDSILYIENRSYGTDTWYGDDEHMEDVLPHEQGVDGTADDTGGWVTGLPGDTFQARHCLKFAGAWWDDNITIENTVNLTNVYVHLWAGGGVNWDDMRIHYGRMTTLYDFGWLDLTENVGESWNYLELGTNASTRTTHVITNSPATFSDPSGTDNTARLVCEYINISQGIDKSTFGSSSIYNFFLGYDNNGSLAWSKESAILLNNRSFLSFLIFNIPQDIYDGTNTSTDSDGDGLSDYHEMNVSFTHPFLVDTDGDGVNDNIDAYPNDYTKSEYDTIIRTNGVDYFVWIGENVSAYSINSTMSSDGCSFDEANEYIAIWNSSGSWDSNWYVDDLWYQYHGANASGNNFTIHTFDILKVVLTDSGDVTINMIRNSNIDYTTARNVSLTNTTNVGANYVGWTDDASTTLNDIADTMITTLLDNGEYLCLWNETNYAWDFFIVGFYEPAIAVLEDDVIMIKVEDQEYIEIGGK